MRYCTITSQRQQQQSPLSVNPATTAYVYGGSPPTKVASPFHVPIPVAVGIPYKVIASSDTHIVGGKLSIATSG